MGTLSKGRTHEVRIYDFGVTEETRSPIVVQLCERAGELSDYQEAHSR